MMHVIGFCLSLFLFPIDGSGQHSAPPVEKPAAKIPVIQQKAASLINADDSVIFDLSTAVVNGNLTEFPVSFASDDSVFSLDFAFRYDLQQAIFDSLYVESAAIQYLYFYNPADSTFRFTSSSLSPMLPDTPLVVLRFLTLNGPLCMNDIEFEHAWLNGEVCSGTVENCVVSSSPQAEQTAPRIRAFPNPTRDLLSVEVYEPSSVTLLDAKGACLVHHERVFANEKIEIPVSQFMSGIYIVRVTSSTGSSNVKVQILK